MHDEGVTNFLTILFKYPFGGGGGGGFLCNIAKNIYIHLKIAFFYIALNRVWSQ